MAYTQHARFVMGGTLGSGADAEIFACSINGTFESQTGPEPDHDAWLAAVSAPLRAWWAQATSTLRNDALLTQIKLNEIGPDGKYLHPNTPHTLNVTPTAGATAPQGPSFVMSAWSWRTNVTGKLARNGRVYLPTALIGATAGSDRISAAGALQMANAGASLINILSTTYSSSLYFLPGVFSKSGGANGKIVQVRVGDVLDVQRRRKNKLKESYTVNTTVIN